MALADYYRCDICEGKAIYDADIYERWERAGDMAIICKSCAESHEVVVVPKNRVVELELALQNYMDAVSYADKDTLVAAIGAAHTEAVRLLPKRIHPSTSRTGASP